MSERQLGRHRGRDTAREAVRDTVGETARETQWETAHRVQQPHQHLHAPRRQRRRLQVGAARVSSNPGQCTSRKHTDTCARITVTTEGKV
jgi:hypothetical protein